jgi:hypothetical protein
MAILKSVAVALSSLQTPPRNSSARLRIAGKNIVDFVAFNLHDLPNGLIRWRPEGVDGAKCIASIACSGIEQKENSV